MASISYDLLLTRQQLGLSQLMYFSKYAWQTFWAVLRDNVDVVHCHDNLNLPVGVLLKLLKRIPLVYDAHEIYWIMEKNRYPKLILFWIKHTEIFLLKFIDALITVGAKRVEYYQPHYKRKIYLVGNWYDCRQPDVWPAKLYASD